MAIRRVDAQEVMPEKPACTRIFLSDFEPPLEGPIHSREGVFSFIFFLPGNASDIGSEDQLTPNWQSRLTTTRSKWTKPGNWCGGSAPSLSLLKSGSCSLAISGKEPEHSRRTLSTSFLTTLSCLKP